MTDDLSGCEQLEERCSAGFLAEEGHAWRLAMARQMKAMHPPRIVTRSQPKSSLQPLSQMLSDGRVS